MSDAEIKSLTVGSFEVQGRKTKKEEEQRGEDTCSGGTGGDVLFVVGYCPHP